MMQTFENQQPEPARAHRGSAAHCAGSGAKTQLATLVEALLAEIAATLAREVGNEQDHQ